MAKLVIEVRSQATAKFLTNFLKDKVTLHTDRNKFIEDKDSCVFINFFLAEYIDILLDTYPFGEESCRVVTKMEALVGRLKAKGIRLIEFYLPDNEEEKKGLTLRQKEFNATWENFSMMFTDAFILNDEVFFKQLMGELNG